jgi:3-methylcrotonyl-CoA carboxylase beta subunit
MIVCNDATVKGGTYYPMTVKKHLRAQEIAQQNRLPCIYLVDSGGANLPNQDEVFPDRDHFGRIFYNQANMSAQGIPQIAVVMGSCTAGGAYVPAMSDETIIVKNQGTIFLGGPPLVKAATGEVVSAEDLGGGDVHTRLSGVADHLAQNDLHALALARRRGNLNRASRAADARRSAYTRPRAVRRDPHRHAQALRRARDHRPHRRRQRVRRVQGALRHHAGLRLARIEGMPVGIVANNGILFSESAQKGAHFIELCCQRKIPLVFLQNITGFMVGPQVRERRHRPPRRQDGHGRGHGSVPKFTVIIGGSFGAGNYGMCGRAYAALPVDVAQRAHQRDGRRAGRQRAGHRQARRHRGQGRQWSAEEEEAFKAPIRQQYEDQGHPYYATARLWDDGVIDPADTRRVLALGLSAARNAPIEDTKFGVFRM